MRPLDGTVLVTGASRGIGRAISLRLSEGGWRVVGIGRDFSGFPLDTPGFTAVELDLADLDRLPARLAALLRDHPGIATVVSNAGGGRFGSLEEFSPDQIRDGIELNLISHMLVARAVVPSFKRRGRGDLIFMGSEAGLAGGRRGAVYAAAKAGLRGLARSLRQESASSGVRVSLINPGMVRTEFFAGLDFAPGESADNALRPEDVAGAVAMILAAPPGTVFDEINLSPLKKVVRFRGPETKP